MQVAREFESPLLRCILSRLPLCFEVSGLFARCLCSPCSDRGCNHRRPLVNRRSVRKLAFECKVPAGFPKTNATLRSESCRETVDSSRGGSFCRKPAWCSRLACSRHVRSCETLLEGASIRCCRALALDFCSNHPEIRSRAIFRGPKLQVSIDNPWRLPRCIVRTSFEYGRPGIIGSDGEL
jgi:hypothetical protein